jgi:hypothetical protein
MAGFAIQWKLKYDIVQDRILGFRAFSCVLLGKGIRTLSLLCASLCVLPVFLGADPLGVQSIKSRRQTGRQIERKSHVPSNTANLPPLGSANDPLHHVFASKRLDKIYRSFVTGGGGNYEADDMDPGRRRGADVYEGLQFFDRVPWIENWKLSIRFCRRAQSDGTSLSRPGNPLMKDKSQLGFTGETENETHLHNVERCII